MLLDVLDDLSGVSFEMICIFDDCVASADDCVFCHRGLSGWEFLYKWRIELCGCPSGVSGWGASGTNVSFGRLDDQKRLFPSSGRSFDVEYEVSCVWERVLGGRWSRDLKEETFTSKIISIHRNAHGVYTPWDRLGISKKKRFAVIHAVFRASKPCTALGPCLCAVRA